MDDHLVTVLMPVYNAERFLKRAIDSILNQSFKNIEFLIINDGSTDLSLQIIKSYKDDRIKLIENDKNYGLIYSLNKGIEIANGKYIARMDADDISYPERIKKQYTYLEGHVNVGILGTLIKGASKFKTYANNNLNTSDLKARIIFNNIFYHPTVIFRSSFIKNSAVLYNPDFKHGEDYQLWLSALRCTDFAIINEPLLYYENHPDQVSAIYNLQQRAAVIKSLEFFFNQINLIFTANELEIHRRLFYQDYIYDVDFLNTVEKWVLKIASNTELEKIVGKETLQKTVSVIWFEVCTHFASNRIDTYQLFYESSCAKPQDISSFYKALFLLKRIKNKLK
jgi:glycosyltransferase involved in cell wall biosynthesis